MTMLQKMTEEEILIEINRRLEGAIWQWGQVNVNVKHEEDEYEHIKARQHELETIKGLTEEIRRRLEDK